jgi:hypothetical protein
MPGGKLPAVHEPASAEAVASPLSGSEPLGGPAAHLCRWSAALTVPTFLRDAAGWEWERMTVQAISPPWPMRRLGRAVAAGLWKTQIPADGQVFGDGVLPELPPLPRSDPIQPGIGPGDQDDRFSHREEVELSVGGSRDRAHVPARR